MYFIVFIIVFRINVAVKRVGGGFGAKINGSHQIAAACALAAYHTRKLVSIMCLFLGVEQILILNISVFFALVKSRQSRFLA